MARSIIAKRKKARRGRPKTGALPMVGMRFAPEARKAVEAWAKRQPDKPTFSEAVRRLIERGLRDEPVPE
jgi:hypothetical protein